MFDAINYINSLGLHRVQLGLHRISKILEGLDNPHKKLSCIIIAGTNGKGSVAALLAGILRAARFRVGLYTSPHLIRITERIKVNDGEISNLDLNNIITNVKSTADDVLAKEPPSYFEVLTAAAFVYFYKKQVDFAVLEVGMGGRYDATNVADPIVSVITNVYLDHTEYLGDNVERIAYEKAGVIKHGVPVVTGANGLALDVISNIAARESARVFCIQRDFSSLSDRSNRFTYIGHSLNLSNVELGLPGFYQVENATIAIAAAEIMRQHCGTDISEKSLRIGLSTAKWEGRMETLRTNPPLILDGAHNPSAAASLRISLQHAYPGKKFLFLIGMLSDKDHENYLKALSPIAQEIIITAVPSERGMPPEELAKIARSHVDRVTIIEDAESAFMEIRKHDSTPTCVSGSLYLVGAIKKSILLDSKGIKKQRRFG